MTTIKNIRVLKNAAVLAERKATTASLDLKRYNLFYGFNGSGKSTLSRILSALQHGKMLERLPTGCAFEIELSDGTKLASPKKLAGMEMKMCVFNGDFIAQNLRWENSNASPIFYIGADQAEAAEKLKELVAKVPAAEAKLEGELKVRGEREKAFNEFKRVMARTIAEQLRQGNRYDATNLKSDVEAFGFDPTKKLNEAERLAAESTCARASPPAKVPPVTVPVAGIEAAVSAARELCGLTIGSVIVEGLDAHPEMVPWVRDGHVYHQQHGLLTCLHCGEKIPDARKALLTSAFDDKLTKFINRVEEGAKEALLTSEQLAVATAALPAAAQLSAEFQPAFEKAASALAAALKDTQPMLKSALDGLRQRGLTPTNPVVIELPDAKSVAARLGTLKTSCEAVNAVIKQHADMVDTFTDHQAKAREAIRRHYIAANEKEFAEQTGGIATATTNVDAGQGALNSLNTEIADLRAKVQKHGPAAEKINKLVKSYLGHEELTIVPVVEGYELHRHSALAEGPPSEGEKGAIALCYFLSTLEAEDRKLKDLIVVIDDPVSSLDTKAMNFACTLIRNRLNDAAQLIVFTHNQHCMNEFKKGWKKRARPDDPTKDPTARLLYIDVTVPEATGTRTASIVELPKQLREYESEYHFLFQKVLELEAAGKGYFEYAFMMPNVLRRVLEIFLAFKEPHHGPLTDKLKAMSKRFAELDGDRLNALERLSQVESHSDNLDDLITQSSMTVEESRDANAALIFLMEKSDGDHLAGLRKYCKA